jgi:hypothetical protein
LDVNDVLNGVAVDGYQFVAHLDARFGGGAAGMHGRNQPALMLSNNL